MKGILNIYRDNFLEKEELVRLMSFIRDNPALFLFVSNAQSFGIVQQGASLTLDPAFKIQVGTNANTIKLGTGSYALDRNGNLIYQRAFDNLPIPTDDTWYWVKISHRYDNYEQGFVNLAADGTLSGVGTTFTDVLRGNSSGFPTKVKFYIQDEDGSLTPANNSGIYEITSVAGDNTAIVSGSFVAEDNLRYVVLGAFSARTSIGSITSQGIYSYDSCNVEFIEEETTDTPPTTDFVTGEDFYVARIKSDGATVSVEDKRVSYYFRLNFGDIIVSNKANINASNLTNPDVLAWLEKLSVYTQSEVDDALSGFLQASENLNDLDDKTTARSNLEVYSTTYIDGIIEAPGEWQTPSYINGWAAGTIPLRYRVNNGYIEFKGSADGTSATDVTAFQLPGGFIPDADKYTALRNNTFPLEFGGLRINSSNGYVILSTSGLSNKVLYFDGIKLPLL